MKSRVLLAACVSILSCIIYTGFSPKDEGRGLKPDPRTRINSGPVIQDYQPLPYVDNNIPVINEPVFNITPQGVFVVNSPFRVHPITAIPSHQTTTPITRHPTNPSIMFASALTSRGGNGTDDYGNGWYVTTNAGTTWFGNDTMFNTVGAPVYTYGKPAPIIDGSGRFLISYRTPSLSGVMGSSYSTNNGVNWSNTVLFPGGNSDPDWNTSCTDAVPFSSFYLRSYAYYTPFLNAFGGRIVGTYTSNQGVSWAAIAPVSPPYSPDHHHQGVDTKCGPNGEVYVVWANCSSMSPYTEDSLGFAKSTNGGVSWVIANNHVKNVNGNRTGDMINGVRSTGFPRIDVDKTCGSRAGWIYVVMGEKWPGIAGDLSDIILYKSTDGGTTWSSGVRVNQDPFGNFKKQYMAAIRVDESGAVNVVYYDTRNTVTNDSSEVFLSRSTDGGVTFVDTKVGNKFLHGNTGVPGIESNYGGDFIGITSSLISGNPVTGNQRIWPYWMANNGTPGGQLQAFTVKVELLPVNPCAGCEIFSNASFTPNYFNLEFTGTQHWTRETPSAYGLAFGSAKYNFFGDNRGPQQSLVTSFAAVGSGYYLTFDQAYAGFAGPTFGPDTLIVESSTNNGATYTTRAILNGGVFPNPGNLNTAPFQITQFTPTNSQWAPKIYTLPAGTNKVRLRARSQFGNNLYIDNVCIQPHSTPVANSIGVVPEGLYSGSTLQDTVRVYLARTDFPNVKVDSSISVIGDNAVVSNLNFSNALSGTYYKVVRHRNSIETWSKAGGEVYTRGSNVHFKFINPQGQAFGNNQKQVSPFDWAMFSGDCNQDFAIDGTDLSLIDNDAYNFVLGYVVTDLTGDNVVDGSDYAIADNNAFNFVVRVAPPGGALDIQQSEPEPKFQTEADRQKYEEGLRIQKEMQPMNPPVQSKKLSYKEFLKLKGNPDWEAPRKRTNDKIHKQDNVDVRTNGKRVGDL